MSNDDKNTALLARLGEQAEALRTSDGWQEWLHTAARFHTYSLNNQLLILAQRPSATRVAGYRAWQSIGRQVRRGERALRIFAPQIRKVQDATTGEESPSVVGFRLVSVFDVSQTDGQPLPEQTMPAVASHPEGLYEHLHLVAAQQGWSVESVQAASNSARGWWLARTQIMTIVSAYSVASRTRTLLHELAHAFDDTVPGRNDSASRAESELIAESVAFVVGTSLGMDLNEASTFYVTSWGADVETLRGIAQRVLTLSAALTEAITDTAAVGAEMAA